ncbi:sialate O-acetylesterase [Gaetbulibacter sp. M240]|uniref:sialate O-acetylesterase n=1 Tax=Gaetbulibacter sp. M240 TaxID=3126511 RepID=UPI00374F380A
MNRLFFQSKVGSILIAFVLIQETIAQNVSMPNIFGSNMVLQQNTQVPIWGWGKPGSEICLKSSWGESLKTVCDIEGNWIIKVKTPKAMPGEAPVYDLSILGPSNTIELKNILIGEVWLCSGQSNMEFPLKPKGNLLGVVDYENEIAKANYRNIRLFNVKKDSSNSPQVNFQGIWSSCTPKTVADFSAVAYYFGKELNSNKKLNVPIGLIQSAFSGSGIQCWMKRELLASDLEFKKEYLEPVTTSIYKKPSIFYNAMIAPLIPFAIKGTIWYQGESNVGQNDLYAKANMDLIKDWRKDWGRDFSFYAVQMTPRFYKDKEDNDTKFTRGYFREAQSSITNIFNTGIVVTSDLMLNPDERSDSHPRNKKDIGIRLALMALSKDYAVDVQYLGPVYKSHKIHKNKIIISFTKESLGNGLSTKDNEAVKGFKISGKDVKFYPAKAVIKGNKIIVSSPFVNKPVAVRYAFTDGAMTNLQNKSGLPVYPFRTDNFQPSNAVDISELEIK